MPGFAGISCAGIVERILGARRIEQVWFAPGKARATLPRQLRHLRDEWTKSHGAFVMAEDLPGVVSVRFEHAIIRAQVALDENGLVAGLFFLPPLLTGGALEDYAEAIIGLPGRTCLLVTIGGQVRIAHHAETSMAVGSAFKLWVLHALDHAIAAGELAWDQVVKLAPRWRSLPSGILQSWPDATPVTLMTLACLMISLSDNTATDALIDVIGRSRIDALTPEGGPLLTTREAFVLKSAQHVRERACWLSGNASERRILLGNLSAAPLPSVGGLSPGLAPEVGWWFSAWDICRTLEATAGLPPFKIEPGPADASHWRHVAYKGGYEPRVLNASVVLDGEDGVRRVVVATWNADLDIDPERFFTPLRALISALEEGVYA